MPRPKGSKNRVGIGVEVNIQEPKPKQGESPEAVNTATAKSESLGLQPTTIIKETTVSDVFKGIKPCPKCQSTRIGQTYTDGHNHTDKIQHGRHYFLYCAECGYKGLFSRRGYEEARKFWNEQ